MQLTSVMLAVASSLSSASAAYTLQHNYTAANWMSSFGVQSLGDPTGGFVNYLPADQAQSSGLYKTIGNQVYMGVDNTTVLSTTDTGRNSVRIASNAAFNHALIIADFAHIPATACGTWPAFWMLGSGNWPANGEIDIIEAINNSTRNQMTIHSSPGCNVTVGAYGQTGTSGSITDCGHNSGYDGCTVFASGSKSYGNGFNAAGGGVYTMHWTGSEIKVWLFPKGSVPADIKSGGAPQPDKWGTPQASWAGCAFDDYFRDMTLLFDTTFCGSWAGAQWSASPTCKTKADTCVDYVAKNPEVFSDSYWLINSVRVYNG